MNLRDLFIGLLMGLGATALAFLMTFAIFGTGWL